MPERLSRVAVLTADIVHSTQYDKRDRQRLDTVLRSAFREAGRRFPGAIHTQMAFRITAGDEFQCVVADVPRALVLLTYVRALAASGGIEPPLRFRAGVGVGDLILARSDNPYEQDGSAFARARKGLESLTGSRGRARWTRLVTETPETDTAAEAILGLGDFVVQRWTLPQWQAIRWALLGLKRQEIASRLKIAHQNVTKRLLSGGWPQFQAATTFLAGLLAEPAGIRGRRQGSSHTPQGSA